MTLTHRILIFGVTLLALVASGFFDGHGRASDGVPASRVAAKTAVCTASNTFFLTKGQDFNAPLKGTQCVVGGKGSNSIFTHDGPDWVNGKNGTDPIYLGAGQDIAYGGKEGDHIEGAGGDDTLLAGCPGGCDQSGARYLNLLKGGSGNDILGADNNVGNDKLKGGPGFDRCYGDKTDHFFSCEEIHK